MKNIRLERINSEMEKAINHIIQADLRDPQIDAIISVTQVQITPDLANANVYISCIGNTDKNEVLARIRGAAGFIRGKLSKAVKLRITPRLEFKLDNSTECSQKIDSILNTITYSTHPENDVKPEDKDD